MFRCSECYVQYVSKTVWHDFLRQLIGGNFCYVTKPVNVLFFAEAKADALFLVLSSDESIVSVAKSLGSVTSIMKQNNWQSKRNKVFKKTTKRGNKQIMGANMRLECSLNGVPPKY